MDDLYFDALQEVLYWNILAHGNHLIVTINIWIVYAQLNWSVILFI